MSISALISYILMGFALAADASSVSLVYGASFRPFKWRYAAIPALAFGFAQAVMPAIGWVGGGLIASFIETIDHWVAFIILPVVGGKFIIDSRHENDAEAKDVLKPWPIFLAAFATSIDACAVGFSLALQDAPILVPALIFGIITFGCSILCCRIGAKLGEKFGPKLLLIGGIILILIGIKILLEHLIPGLIPF